MMAAVARIAELKHEPDLGGTSRIDILADAICEAVDHWLMGQPSQAIDVLDLALSNLDPAVREHISSPVGTHAVGHLFRLRSTSESTLSRERLFHIPFNLRDRVSTQRYSFPGLPCLYLGHSSYVCWKECGQPPDDEIWISRFEVAKGHSVRLLDFGRTPAMTAAMLNSVPTQWSKAASYAVLWPLIAACSVQRRTGTADGFVVEYVVPQMLLRWIVSGKLMASWLPEERIEGIRYFSTCIDNKHVSIAGMNYVFPVQTKATKGHIAWSSVAGINCIGPPAQVEDHPHVVASA